MQQSPADLLFPNAGGLSADFLPPQRLDASIEIFYPPPPVFFLTGIAEAVHGHGIKVELLSYLSVTQRD